MSDDSKVADLGNYIVIHLLRHTIYRTKIGFEEISSVWTVRCQEKTSVGSGGIKLFLLPC